MVLTIDPETQIVSFWRPFAPLPKEAVKVPFELRDGRIFVQIKINDKRKMEALVDTASVGTLLPSDVAKGMKLASSTLVDITGPEGKPAKVSAVELPEVDLGALKIRSVEAVFISEGKAGNLSSGAAILGTDVLLRYRLTIDYGRRILAFEPLKSLGAAAVTDTAPKNDARPSTNRRRH